MDTSIARLIEAARCWSFRPRALEQRGAQKFFFVHVAVSGAREPRPSFARCGHVIFNLK